MGLTAAREFVHDPDALRDTARELLARPPYRERAPGPVTDLLARGRRWLAEMLDAILGPLANSETFAWIVVIVAVLAVAALAWRWGRRVGRDRAVAASAPAREGPRSSREWREDAKRHADSGRWRSAVRAAYGAVASDLAERGILDQPVGLTVGEIDRQVRDADPDRAEAVATAGQVFEDVWYGHRDATAEDVTAVLAAAGPVDVR